MIQGIKTLLATPVNDMTVGDAVKLNVLALTATVAAITVWTAGFTAQEKFVDWNEERKLKNLEEATPETAE